MKKFLLLITLAVMGFVTSTLAQSKDGATDVKYRRSSLHTILVETEKFPNKDVVVNAFYNAPFPEKYNNHVIGAKSFNPNQYPLTKEEKATIFKEQSKAGKFASGAADITIDTAARELPLQIQKYFNQNKIGNQLVAKWFNRQEDGSFNMSLIQERGFYNASEMEANIAKGAARGTASLADAGIELIGNTFVVVCRFNFVSNEVVARVAKDAAYIAANKLSVPALQTAAKKTADEVYEKAKEGYSVWATAFLYQLVWNDSVEAVFYNDLWMDASNPDPKKKEAFNNSDLFKLQFIGDESASGLVLFSLKEKRTEQQIIEIATVRAIDAVYAKLQKKYDVFKTKTPLFTGNPITAKIGLKEGLESGDKFEVLEQTQDPKTGLTKYVSKGTVTVDDKLIWDNRYNAGDDPATEGENPAAKLDRTTFKGGSKYFAGMLIRQVK